MKKDVNKTTLKKLKRARKNGKFKYKLKIQGQKLQRMKVNQKRRSLGNKLNDPSGLHFQHKKCIMIITQRQKSMAKSAYEPSGLSGGSLSWFLQHEATSSISTPRWMVCQSIAKLPPQNKFTGIHLYTWVERGITRVQCLNQEPKKIQSCFSNVLQL